MNMQNNWQRIWNNRAADLEGKEIDINNEELICELKRANGYDLFGSLKNGQSGVKYEAFIKEFEEIKKYLNHPYKELNSVYEVGCGSGINLMLFEQNNVKTGGCDYSESLIKSAVALSNSSDISCMEAINLTERPLYDAVFAKGVFLYFPDEVYATKVLEKMYAKAKYTIGVLTVMDKEKESEFYAYRKKIQPDYDEKYKNLSRLFLDKSFFTKFASSHNMNILITENIVQDYWNTEFVYSCYMYKYL